MHKGYHELVVINCLVNIHYSKNWDQRNLLGVNQSVL